MRMRPLDGSLSERTSPASPSPLRSIWGGIGLGGGCPAHFLPVPGSPSHPSGAAGWSAPLASDGFTAAVAGKLDFVKSSRGSVYNGPIRGDFLERRFGFHQEKKCGEVSLDAQKLCGAHQAPLPPSEATAWIYFSKINSTCSHFHRLL